MANYRCGAVAVMTVISYYGSPVNNTDVEEGRIARERNPTVSEAPGINPEQISSSFNRNGWNATWATGGSREMLRTNPDAGIPTMTGSMASSLSITASSMPAPSRPRCGTGRGWSRYPGDKGRFDHFVFIG